MKLYYAPASPFSRKVRAALVELDLEQDTELITVDPFANERGHWQVNPLGKIPALVTDDGQSICGSSLVMQYLEEQSQAFKLTPEDKDKRWTILRLESMAHGVIDAAYGIVSERRRPEEIQMSRVIDRQWFSICRALDLLERTPFELSTAQPTLLEITLGCALGYLDFRLPFMEWRDNYPRLCAWYDQFASRESMQRTQPAE